MPNPKNIGTKEIPLEFAKKFSVIVNSAWDSGKILSKVSPVSADLLRFWFEDSFCQNRGINFHAGQRQAILNAIYAHEVLGVESTLGLYEAVDLSLIDSRFLQNLGDKKYAHPKYCIKMATGTGKTWVLNALLIWQYLNANHSSLRGSLSDSENNEAIQKNKIDCHESAVADSRNDGATHPLRHPNAREGEQNDSPHTHSPPLARGNSTHSPSLAEGARGWVIPKFSKNFLLVAPGLIVYERLVDSFCGKEDSNGMRDFHTSDIYKNSELFLPQKYKESVLAFIANATLKKDEIGKRHKSDGFIAITNWHLLMEQKEQIDEISPLKNPKAIVADLLPLTPNISKGNALETLDNANRGDILDFLAGIENICVFNDEAHHIHENKKAGENLADEVLWQKSLNAIAKGKGRDFIQIDFSATPYNVTGSGQNRQKHYFPHIISDFGLYEAVRGGLVKLIAIDKRKEFATLENEAIDFKAKRDERKKVIDLSDGQRLMLNAGLAKLEILEDAFLREDSHKHPKMLVICEDTSVSPLVEEFFIDKGLSKDEIMRIDSNAKGEISTEEWKRVKQILFNIDSHKSPKVIISVLMLREGFDVNNICVIVPLRSSQAPILLEQVIGRGLRLMWRNPDYTEIKMDNIKRVMIDKLPPSNYLDILSIVEHPEFERFYEDLDEEIVINDTLGKEKGSVVGDIIEVGLKADFTKYDMYIPLIISDREEILKPLDSSAYNFSKFGNYSLAQMRDKLKNYTKETFQSEEIMVKTRFGEYKVDMKLFSAQSYNDFLVKIANATNATKRAQGGKTYPLIQLHSASLVGIIDRFIRNDLFGESFNPLNGEDWKILMLHKEHITQHILREINHFIVQSQNSIDIKEAVVQKEYFSSVASLKMRENFCIDITKSIYEKTAYPSNKGGFEKDFMEFCDKDSAVEKFIKINENHHNFAHLHYIRTDGLIASYCPDFIAQSGESVFLIETKAQKDISNENVINKRNSAVAFCEKINALKSSDRMGAKWSYHLLDDKTFYALQNRGANLNDILSACELAYKNEYEKKLF